MSVNIHEIEVNTRQEFIHLVEQLKNNLEQCPEDWENVTLSEFLDALSRYAEDIQQYYINTNQNIDVNAVSWRVFADLLRGASIYE